MSFLSFGKKEEQVSLVIDVGNSSITCAIVLFKGRDLPIFLYSSTQVFDVKEVLDASRLIEALSVSLESQLQTINKEGFNHKYWQDKDKKFESAIISFSSPWFVLKTKHLVISNEKEFVVTEAFLDDVIDQEEKVFISELANNTQDAFEIVEKNIIHTKINGYTLNNTLGKKTKNLDAVLCMSAMDRGVVEKVFNSILRHAHVPKEKIALHTFPLVSFSVIRDFFSSGNDFLIMDITGDMSDITLVQDSIIMQTVSMPSGRNFVLRQISKTFDVSIEIAESMLHLYNAEKIQDTEKQKMQELIELIEREWAIYFENALLELSPGLSLPTSLYLMAESDVSLIYNQFIGLSKVDATSSFRKSVKVTNIDENSVKNFYKNESTGRVDEFIAFVALFYKKIINSSAR